MWTHPSTAPEANPDTPSQDDHDTKQPELADLLAGLRTFDGVHARHAPAIP